MSGNVTKQSWQRSRRMPTPVKPFSRLRAGDLEVDIRSGEVRRNGEKIKLGQRAFQILVVLMQHPGEVVTREEIRQNLWPGDTFVDFEHGINTAVKKLREAVGDNAQAPQYIETLPRYGYRFLPPVESLGTNGVAQEGETPVSPPQPQEVPRPVAKKRRLRAAAAGGLIAFLTIGVFLGLRRQRSRSAAFPAWTQITRFSDSATQPALSPDGGMIAFIRGAETFVTPGEIYVKILPDGEPVQLTHDNLPKMAPAFSPDGSRIAYTATDRSFNWDTWVVPVLGGEPRRLLPNAASLTWPDHQHVLFSELRQPPETMAIVTADESRAKERDIYLPAPAGMAHRSWTSPDGKWILLSEMDAAGWMPCRVVSFDGSSPGWSAGPNPARCTYAGWSPDGKTMYFSADAGNGFHIWRQRFPHSAPEQLTAGATEEEGIAVSPDGRSLVTSAGIKESTVWVHDTQGDRPASGEGFASVPGLGYGGEVTRSVFSPDGKKLFYLVRKQNSRAWTSGELWSTDLGSGKSEAALPGIAIDSVLDIAPDGKQVAFQTSDANGAHVWVASLDRLTPPQLVTPSVASSPGFGPGGRIYFLARDGDRWLLHGAASEGSGSSADRFARVSPRGNWWLTGVAPVTAHPAQKGPEALICKFCSAGWGPDGRFFYLRFRGVGEMGGGSMIVIALPPGKELPPLPPGGVNSIEDARGLNVVEKIDMNDKAIFAPGPNSSVYAYTRVTVKRNLYRIPLD
jgi:DNA-binding winged helix-turn-helix (wHTH) protein/Tol biopolymer transport system component